MDGYSYVLELVDQLSGPAKTAKDALGSLQTSLSVNTKTLRQMQAEFQGLAATGQLSTEQTISMSVAIAKQQALVDKNAKSIRDLVSAEQKDVKAKHDEASAAKKASDDSAGLGETLSALGPYAAIAAAALAVLGGAMIGLVIGGGKIALEASLFKSQSLAALKSTLGTSEAAAATFEDIRRISDEVGVTEKKANTIGLALLDAGVPLEDLGTSIKNIALLEKVRGEQAAGKLQELIKKSAAGGAFKLEGESLVGTGLSKSDIVAELSKNLGVAPAIIEAKLKAGQIKASEGIAAINGSMNKLALGGGGLTSAGDAVEKLYERFSRLFEDIKVAPLIDAFAEIGSWLDKSTVAGGALHWLFTTIFDGIFGAAKAVLPYVKTGFLELVIVALRIYIAMKPLVKQVQELGVQLGIAGGDGDTLGSVIRGVVDALGFLVLLNITILQGFVWLISTGVDLFVTLSDAASSAWAEIQDGLSTVWETIKALFNPETAAETALALIDGLVDGITGGASRVVDALTGVGKSAIAGVKGILGIASPSKVMAEIGGQTSEGFAGGAEGGEDRAQGALASVVAPPRATSAGGGGGPSITIGEGAIVINAGSASASEIGDMLESRLSDMLEGLLMQLGGATAS